MLRPRLVPGKRFGSVRLLLARYPLEDLPHRWLRRYLGNHRLVAPDDPSGEAQEEGCLSLVQPRGVRVGADIRGEPGNPCSPAFLLAAMRDSVDEGLERDRVKDGADVARCASRADVLDEDVARAFEGGSRMLTALRLDGLVGERTDGGVGDLPRCLIRLRVERAQQVRPGDLLPVGRRTR